MAGKKEQKVYSVGSEDYMAGVAAATSSAARDVRTVLVFCKVDVLLRGKSR